MYASRNLDMCSKDCLCLFVCPTGATDTENGQIDKSKCIDGCRLCVDACPSKAIYLVPEKYPEPIPKKQHVALTCMQLCAQKYTEEGLALTLSEYSENPVEARIARAIMRSARILAEDCAREAGYLTPQCRTTRDLLESFPDAATAHELVRKLYD